MFYVIGSGPAGVSCAYALLKRGEKVTMLDVGLELEPKNRKIIENSISNHKNSKPEDWSQKEIALLKKGMEPTSKGVPLKRAYGSDYSYREAGDFVNASYNGVLCKPSFGEGGLSAVWGASVMPYLKEDMSKWPVSISELKPYYQKVFEFMPFACNTDSLTTKFPSYVAKNKTSSFEYSSQASNALNKMQKNKSKLNSNGIFFGSSRLAVEFNKCTLCTLCMYGCPYELIYNTASTLSVLKENPNFTYINNTIVEKVFEKSDSQTVEIHAINKITKKSLKIQAERVFLACGSLPTTKIMLNSMKLYNEPVQMIDSQYFLFPLLSLKKGKNVESEKLHTLAQLYLEILDKKIDKNSIHLQIYTYSDLYAGAMKSMFGPLYKPLKPFLNLILGRMHIVQGYLHSDASSQFSVTLINNKNKNSLKSNSNSKLEATIIQNPNAKKKVKKVVFKLIKNFTKTGFFPLFPMLQIGKAGEGNHYGGSFPMKKTQSKTTSMQSDILGRPNGAKRIHLVDSSIFPSISSQTITLTIMANAYRIGDTFDKLK